MTSRYPIPWVATYFLTAGGLIAAAFLLGSIVSGVKPEFDYNDADIIYLERIVLSAAPRHGDFTKFNSGDWALICLLGSSASLDGVKGPETGLKTLRAVLEEKPLQLHESEFTLIYVTKGDEVRRIRHPHGWAFARADAVHCITPEKPVVDLPINAKSP